MQIVVRERAYEVPEFPYTAGGGFAFGMPRAGSTMLFNSLNLMAHDSNVRYFDFELRRPGRIT